jgi:hypothetical protein
MILTPDPLRYPIGHFVPPEVFNTTTNTAFRKNLAEFPLQMQREVAHLTAGQLDTAYRPEGWTVRQVIHHCADSHMNAFMRFKLALTEDKPVIKPYLEALWAELPDTRSMPIEPSLAIITALHARWTVLLDSLDEAAWHRQYIHPDHDAPVVLYKNVAMYAWHGAHHLAQITGLKQRNNWK